MIVQILQHTPLWVWIALATVGWLGFVQTRDRAVSRARALIFPWAFVLLSLCAVAAGAGELPLALLVWGLGFAAAWAGGGRLVAIRGAAWSAANKRFHVPGSWVPLLLILALFLSKYAFGVAAALNPALLADARFIAGTSLAYGAFAGLFWARARSLRASVAARGRGPADGWAHG
jgi:hypothetical protein